MLPDAGDSWRAARASIRRGLWQRIRRAAGHPRSAGGHRSAAAALPGIPAQWENQFRRAETDAVLNRGGAGSDTGGIDTGGIDTVNPTVTVDIVDGALNDGDTSSVVTFAFSEAPGASFTESDIQVSAGLTLVAGSLSQVDATHYTATVTAADGFSGTGTVSVAAGSYTDATLNPGVAGSDTVAIDTVNPTVTVDIVDAR